jgi:hypothetical protein
MQEVMHRDGSFIREFFMAKDEADMKRQMAAKYKEAMTDDVESIRQSILDLESRCPCGSGKLTINCCVKRLKSYIARQEHFAAT